VQTIPCVRLIAIKIDLEFTFEKYLHLLKDKAIEDIQKYKFRKDQLIAFASYLLKHYYLAQYLNLHPSNINIKYSKNGKPFLEENIYNIDFNITHSGEYIIIAIAHNSLVGVDIELINPNIEVTELSPIICSEYERNLINDDPNNFFIIWTKKEALIKAHGIGFDDSQFYKTTTLNLETIQITSNSMIYNQCFNQHYMLSLCISKES
jgi:4'-phosphopantetheinyl transferase